MHIGLKMRNFLQSDDVCSCLCVRDERRCYEYELAVSFLNVKLSFRCQYELRRLSCTRQTQTNKKDRYKQTDRQTDCAQHTQQHTRSRAHIKRETDDALWPRIIHHIDVNVGMIISQQDCNTHAHTATD